MGSSGAVSETVESKKGLDSVHQFKGSNMLSIKVKAEERGLESHNYPMDGKEIDLSTSSKVVGPSREMATDMLRKKALKKPVKVGVYRASEIVESFTLKQALRKLCISQASEMAASKWSSKPVDVSDAGTIKRLLASVVAPTSGSAGKGKFLEISFVPEKIAKDSSESSSQVDISPASVSSTYRAVSPTAKAQKTRILDVISLTETADDTPAHVEMKGKAKSKKTVCSSKTGDQLIKPNTSPRLVKPVLRNKTIVKKKGKMETGSALTTSSKFKKMNTEGVVPTKTKSACRKESNSPASNGTNASSDIVVTKNKDGGANKRDISPHSCKTTRNRRTREKGESSLSSKSSIGDNSTSTATSKESHRSSNHSGIRPHMSKDVRWDAIRDVVMQNESLGLENFRLLKRLGCGDIGSVYLAELTGSECLFALKVMDVEFLLSRKKMLRAQTEREILQMLDHPFLPTLYANFTTDNLSCLVMEYCPGGDLHVLRQKQPGRTFSEPAARFYVAEVLLALEYLHMLGVVYRDLKPENILVREDGHIMLTDFDLSLRCTVNPTLIRSFSLGLQEPVKRSSGPCAENSCIEPLCIQPSCVQASCFTPRLLLSTTPKTRKPKTDRATQIRLPQLVVEPTDARSNSFVGTHEYLAPEIIIGDGHGSAVDWWTFGIFLYELLFGRTPFKGPGNDETLANIISENLRFPENSAVSTHARDLIRGLLVKEPENRLGSSRGAAEIKQHPFFEGINWALIRCAQPPEIPRSYDVGTLFGERNKEVKSLDFSSDGDDIEFELF